MAHDLYLNTGLWGFALNLMEMTTPHWDCDLFWLEALTKQGFGLASVDKECVSSTCEKTVYENNYWPHEVHCVYPSTLVKISTHEL